jgi:hypothetical protein
MRKELVIMFGVAALLVVAFLIVHFNPLSALWLCSEQTIMEKTSPDGRYVAVLMRQSCRASEPPTAHINIRLASSPPFPNHLFGGPIGDGEIFGTSRFSGERFCWSSPRRVEIDYLAGDNQHPGEWMDVSTGDDYSLCK